MNHIQDEVIDIKYAQYFLPAVAEYINTDKPKQGFILEDCEEIVPECVITYKNEEKFVRSETVMAAQIMKLSEMVRRLQQ